MEATGGTFLDGFQFRYLYLLDPSARERLTVPVIPFSRISEMGATMYRGKRISAGSETVDTACDPAGEGRFDSDPGALTAIALSSPSD